MDCGLSGFIIKPLKPQSTIKLLLRIVVTERDFLVFHRFQYGTVMESCELSSTIISANSKLVVAFCCSVTTSATMNSRQKHITKNGSLSHAHCIRKFVDINVSFSIRTLQTVLFFEFAGEQNTLLRLLHRVTPTVAQTYYSF